MSSKLGIVVADFDTQNSTKVVPGNTSITLQSCTDDDNNLIASGQYFFSVDGDNSQKEYFLGTLDHSTGIVTSVQSISRQGVLSTGFVRTHKVGASIKLTDFANLYILTQILNGQLTLDGSNALAYDAHPTFSNPFQLIDKKYADDIIAGLIGTATNLAFGTVKLSVAAASAPNPIAVGDNDGRVPTQAENDALVGNNTDVAVGSGNKYATQTGIQHNAEKYCVDSSGGSTAYVGTLSPAPTSLTDGMVVYLKTPITNSTTTPTFALNGLTAHTIVKTSGVALAIGDLVVGSNTLQYDLTNTRWVLQTPVANLTTYKNGTTTRAGDAASGVLNIAHGLGQAPKFVTISAKKTGGAGTGFFFASSTGSYNGATNSSSFIGFQPGTSGTAATSGVDNTNGLVIYDNATNTNTQVAIITFDATNIILTFTKAGSPSSNAINIDWTATV